MSPVKVIDLFSGAGGFSLGFNREPFEIKLSVDINHAAARTYSINFPNTVVIEDDIRNITGRDIRYLIGGEPDIIIGSPPCEPFTGANPSRRSDPLERLFVDERGQLTLEFIRIVGELKPKIFIMENVPAIANIDVIRSSIEGEFLRIGYPKVYFNILRAEDLGNPSRRTRVFVSNVKLKQQKSARLNTVWNAIGDLADRPNLLPNHEIAEVSEEKIRKFARLDFGDYLSMFKGSSGRNIPLYIRLNPYRLAPTVMGNSRFIHPFENRFLTVREQARLMSYPDDHVFVGNRDEQYNQVGESVPVVFSTTIAREIMGILYG
ncbi:DNA cytosine methyltransferase [Sulfolobus acidocaldarius]|uniref:DNA (cytosine-5-)-methyltransferase n=4 Tax=Sulfolobus acidocaldarius TaxID=2285 RepID=Q4JAZ4_SULAC|nr:DNA cytosine methyltransferase [Sulfolobus acidocaldarius]AAY80035.1 site-specific DNA methylase [Sulfolobus acidocaldarius DSM 639]AGE70606.1 site-specific DNA methylase [Sulfolobus acidocaldarius N8]AGE72879.1 site-specific DNA methylase [Sulfolobus acidocaldarius Ron12/I]ALU29041.1 modification methylase [Sulfolobus acidocaldarius]ALU31767.1 modification methylase [Sulfolobus acidocaldarius]